MYSNFIQILSYIKFNLIPTIYSFTLLEYHYKFLYNIPKSKLTLALAIETFSKNLNFTNHLQPIDNPLLNNFHIWINISCYLLTIVFYYNRKGFIAFFRHLAYTFSVEFLCVMVASFINSGLPP